MSLLGPILRPILQPIQQSVLGVNSIYISIDAIAGDDYITAAEMAAVTISGTSRQIDDAETLTITATDGTNNDSTTATVSGDAWTADAAIDMTGWDEGAITVTVTLDSDTTVNRTRIATLDAISDDVALFGVGLEEPQFGSGLETPIFGA